MSTLPKDLQLTCRVSSSFAKSMSWQPQMILPVGTFPGNDADKIVENPVNMIRYDKILCQELGSRLPRHSSQMVRTLNKAKELVRSILSRSCLCWVMQEQGKDMYRCLASGIHPVQTKKS